MTVDRKKAIFVALRENLEAAGASTVESGSLICPLCWQVREYDSLSLEHIVPRKVGGRALTLTCTGCNNSHGSDLDAHLSRYQSTRDAFRGHGTLPTVLDVNGKRLVANLEWRDGQKRFVIVGKASDPEAVASVQADFSNGNVSGFNCTIFYEYAKEQFYASILRSAYLALFDRFGYGYVKSEVVQSIRRKICDRTQTIPDLGCLIVELRNLKMPYEASHYIVRCRVKSAECFLVVIRVRKSTTTYLGAYLPNTLLPIERFQEVLEELKAEGDGKTTKISVSDILR